MKEDLGLLHIYAQEREHGSVWIVGTRIGLTALRDAIDQALKAGAGWTPSGYVAEGHFVMASDGEGYDVRVIQDNSDWGAPPSKATTVWDRLESPYVGGGPYERYHPKDGIWPSQLWDWDAENKRMRELEDKQDIS